MDVFLEKGEEGRENARVGGHEPQAVQAQNGSAVGWRRRWIRERHRFCSLSQPSQQILALDEQRLRTGKRGEAEGERGVGKAQAASPGEVRALQGLQRLRQKP